MLATKKNEYWESFTAKYADPLYQESIANMEEALSNSYDEIMDSLVSAYGSLFGDINSLQENGKGPIAYVNFYFLRTGMKLGSDTCLISALDKNWYLDKEPVEHVYSAPYIFRPFYDYAEQIRRERKRYVQSIGYTEIERLLLEKWGHYVSYFSLLLKSAIDKIIGLPGYGFQKDDVFVMNAGEYMDFADILWLEDRTEKDPGMTKKLFERKPENGLCHLHLAGMDLSRGDYSGNNFMGSRFDRVNFQGSKMDCCVMLDAAFTGCDLRQTSLAGSLLWCGDFSHANLRHSDLSWVNLGEDLNYAKLGRPYFPKIKFFDANLSYTNLSYGNFAYADFSGAKLDGCILEGANLRGAAMHNSWKDELALTDEQKGMINWS